MYECRHCSHVFSTPSELSLDQIHDWLEDDYTDEAPDDPVGCPECGCPDFEDL